MVGLHYKWVVGLGDLHGLMIQKMMNPVAPSRFDEKKYNEAEVACNCCTAEANKAAIPYFGCSYLRLQYLVLQKFQFVSCYINLVSFGLVGVRYNLLQRSFVVLLRISIYVAAIQY